MTLQSELTYARVVVGAGASGLTYARVVVGGPSSALTYARVISGAPPFVDTGQPQILDPFSLGELRASVATGTVTAWAWDLLSSSKPGVTVTLVEDGLGGATYQTPAVVGGTVLTFQATATVNGQPISNTVKHTIRHHASWLVVSPGVYSAFRFSVPIAP